MDVMVTNQVLTVSSFMYFPNHFSAGSRGIKLPGSVPQSPSPNPLSLFEAKAVHCIACKRRDTSWNVQWASRRRRKTNLMLSVTREVLLGAAGQKKKDYHREGRDQQKGGDEGGSGGEVYSAE